MTDMDRLDRRDESSKVPTSETVYNMNKNPKLKFEQNYYNSRQNPTFENDNESKPPNSRKSPPKLANIISKNQNNLKNLSKPSENLPNSSNNNSSSDSPLVNMMKPQPAQVMSQVLSAFNQAGKKHQRRQTRREIQIEEEISQCRYAQCQEVDLKVKYLEDITKTIFKFNCIITVLAVLFTSVFFLTARHGIHNSFIHRINILALCFGLVFFGVMLVACLTSFGIVQYIQHLTDTVYSVEYRLEKNEFTLPIFKGNAKDATLNCKENYCIDTDEICRAEEEI